MSSAYIAPDSVQGIRHHCALGWTLKIPSRPFVLQLVKLGSGSKGLSSGSKGRGGKCRPCPGVASVWVDWAPPSGEVVGASARSSSHSPARVIDGLGVGSDDAHSRLLIAIPSLTLPNGETNLTLHSRVTSESIPYRLLARNRHGAAVAACLLLRD